MSSLTIEAEQRITSQRERFGATAELTFRPTKQLYSVDPSLAFLLIADLSRMRGAERECGHPRERRRVGESRGGWNCRAIAVAAEYLSRFCCFLSASDCIDRVEGVGRKSRDAVIPITRFLKTSYHSALFAFTQSSRSMGEGSTNGCKSQRVPCCPVLPETDI